MPYSSLVYTPLAGTLASSDWSEIKCFSFGFFFVSTVRVIKLDDNNDDDDCRRRRRRHSNRSAVVVAVISCILHAAYAPVKPNARAPPTARPGRTPQQKKTAQKRIRGIFSFRIFSRSSATATVVTTPPQHTTDGQKF